MKRKLKILGLALVAVLTMSAVASAAAQAEFLALNTATGETEAAEVQLSAGGPQIFKATGSSSLEVECTSASGAASTTGNEVFDTTFKYLIFGSCSVPGLGLPVHFRTNGCHLTFKASLGFVSVSCFGAALEIEVTKSGGGRKCLILIGTDPYLGTVSYRNEEYWGHGVIDAESEAAEVDDYTEGGLLNCGVANGEHASGVYGGSTIWTAVNEGGEAIDAQVK